MIYSFLLSPNYPNQRIALAVLSWLAQYCLKMIASIVKPFSMAAFMFFQFLLSFRSGVSYVPSDDPFWSLMVKMSLR